MARKRRFAVGGYVYHVCNRGSRRGVILETYEDFADFCKLLNKATEKYGVRIIGYNLLQNHFHLLLWPVRTNDLCRFMKWLEQKCARRFHVRRDTIGTGAVFQSRYVSRPLEDARRYFGALKYVEGNARRHGLVGRAEDWPWCSAWNRESFGPQVMLHEGPIPRPANWLEILNE